MNITDQTNSKSIENLSKISSQSLTKLQKENKQNLMSVRRQLDYQRVFELQDKALKLMNEQILEITKHIKSL